MSAAEAAYEAMRFHAAAAAILAIGTRGNLYMEEVAPWTAFKVALHALSKPCIWCGSFTVSTGTCWSVSVWLRHAKQLTLPHPSPRAGSNPISSLTRF